MKFYLLEDNTYCVNMSPQTIYALLIKAGLSKNTRIDMQAVFYFAIGKCIDIGIVKCLGKQTVCLAVYFPHAHLVRNVVITQVELDKACRIYLDDRYVEINTEP